MYFLINEFNSTVSGILGKWGFLEAEIEPNDLTFPLFPDLVFANFLSTPHTFSYTFLGVFVTYNNLKSPSQNLKSLTTVHINFPHNYGENLN